MASNKQPPPATTARPEDDNSENQCQDRMASCVNVIWGRFSTSVGLCFLLIVFTFLGGGIMLGIEGYYTEQTKAERVPQDQFLGYFVNRTMRNNSNVSSVLDADAVRSLLEEYDASRAQNDELHELREHSYWEWMLFCLTVYTTIGYGSICPVTRPGRIATMFYATIGVPLFLLTMGKIGQNFTRIVKRLWANLRKCFYLKRFRPIRKNKVVQRLTGGGGKQDPRKSEAPKKTQNQLSVPADPENVDVVSYVSYEVDAEFNLNPMVAIIITLVYILLGSLMYVQWEQDWRYHDAFYFIFISVSTIGFGDIYPSHPKFFLLSSIYIMFGLALVAMVINVLMEFFQAKIDAVEDIIPDVLMVDSDEENEEEEEGKDIKAGLGQIAENFQTVNEDDNKK